jgi:Lhr-like helicase
MKMVRKQFYITQDQDEKLKRLAASRDATEAEVVRAALDAVREVNYEQQETALGQLREAAAVMDRYETGNRARAVVNSFEGRRLDAAAWEEELAFMKSLGAGNAGSSREATSWKFNREELYEERLARILRRQ